MTNRSLSERIDWTTREVDRQLGEVLATAALSPDNRERLTFIQSHMKYIREELKNEVR